MTKREFYRWALNHGCSQKPLPDTNTTAFCVILENPKTGGYATLNTPIDDRLMNPETVMRMAVALNIEIPSNLK